MQGPRKLEEDKEAWDRDGEKEPQPTARCKVGTSMRISLLYITPSVLKYKFFRDLNMYYTRMNINVF